MSKKKDRQVNFIRKGQIDFYYPIKITSKLKFEELCKKIDEYISTIFQNFDTVYNRCMGADLQENVRNIELDEGFSVRILPNEESKFKKTYVETGIPTEEILDDSVIELEPTERGIKINFISSVKNEINRQFSYLEDEEKLSRKYYGDFYTSNQTRFLLPPFKAQLKNDIQVWLTSVLYVFTNGMGFLRISLPLINLDISPLKHNDYDSYIKSISNVCGISNFTDSSDHINEIKFSYLKSIATLKKIDVVYQESELSNIILADYDDCPDDVNNITPSIKESLYKIVAAPIPDGKGISYLEEATSYINENAFGKRRIKYITSTIGRCLSIVDNNGVQDIIDAYMASNNLRELQEDDFETIYESVILSARSNVEFAILILMLKKINNSYTISQNVLNSNNYLKTQKEYNKNLIFIASLQESCIFASAKEQLLMFERLMPHFLNAETTAKKIEAMNDIIAQDTAQKSSWLQNFLSIGSLLLTGVFGLPAIKDTLSLLRDLLILQDIPILTIENTSASLWFVLMSIISVVLVCRSFKK